MWIISHSMNSGCVLEIGDLGTAVFATEKNDDFKELVD